MLDFNHYRGRAIAGFILLAVVVIVALTVVLPIMFQILEAARSVSDMLSNGLGPRP